MKPLPHLPSAGAWPVAVALLERWLRRGGRADVLIGELGGTATAAQRAEDRPAGQGDGTAASEADRQYRARCQHLFFGAVRHYRRLNAAIDSLVPRPPRARLRAVLLVGGFELLGADVAPADEGQTARVVHHAVDQAKGLLSPAEARLVNAVLRQMAASLRTAGVAPGQGADAAELGQFFSHPDWLVRRWLAQFGAVATRRLLEWNQTPPPVLGRWRGPGSPPAWLQPTDWAAFYVVPTGHWREVEPLLAGGALYLQDPATLIASDLLGLQPGESVLDLCAAPGGKSLLLADQLEAAVRRGVAGDRDYSAGQLTKNGRVIAVDLPDDGRIKRLKENLAKVHTTDVALVQADVLTLSSNLFKEHGLPTEYSAVLVDVPCSNTGVMRHRVDVKWRLRESDIAKHTGQQLALLTAAARFVAGLPAGSRQPGPAPGGRLVYSTCSLESEENEGVVEAFLRASGGKFILEQTRLSRPWETGCDGAGAFRLRRV